MATLFRSTLNSRWLPTGEDFRFIRSDFPRALTDEEVQSLLRNNVRTIIDLRGPAECLHAPCRLEKEAGFVYLHRPVSVPGGVPSNQEQFAALYEAMVDDELEKIVNAAITAPTRVLFFCGSGQDRTGVVSAAILKELGYDDETIVEDYMKTKENLQPVLEAMAKEHPEIDLELFLPHEENIKIALEALKKRKTK